MAEITSTYPCSQPVLYVANNSIIGHLRANLSTFNNFRGVYDDSLCDLLAEKNAESQLLPNDQMRMLAHETCRTEMVTLGKDCRSKWQRLKLYILHSVPEDQQKSNWEAAGWQYYEAASNESWVSLKEMMTMGSLYITSNRVALMANANMPATFAAMYETSREAFDLKYAEFLDAQSVARISTATKLMANNEIFSMIMSVCNDSQWIYENDAVMREQFTFSKVCDMIAPPGAAAADFTIVNTTTNLPMIAEVMVQGSDKHATTDAATGKCEFTQLASGSTVFVVTADGFVAQNVVHELSPGSASRILVKMVPMFVEVDSQQSAVDSPQSSVGSLQSAVVS